MLPPMASIATKSWDYVQRSTTEAMLRLRHEGAATDQNEHFGTGISYPSFVEFFTVCENGSTFGE